MQEEWALKQAQPQFTFLQHLVQNQELSSILISGPSLLISVPLCHSPGLLHSLDFHFCVPQVYLFYLVTIRTIAGSVVG